MIVVDNASNDPVNLPSHHVIRSSDRVSVGMARNIGLAAVETELVMFLDADDVLLDGVLPQLISPFRDTKNLVLCAGGFVGWRKGSPNVKAWGFPPRWAYSLQRKPAVFAHVNLLKNLVPTVSSAVMSTGAVSRAGGFGDSRLGEDWALAAILPFLGLIHLDPEPVTKLQVRPCSLTTQHQSWAAIIDARSQLRRRLRATSALPPYLRLLSPGLTPFHWISAVTRWRHRHGETVA